MYEQSFVEMITNMCIKCDERSEIHFCTPLKLKVCAFLYNLPFLLSDMLLVETERS